MNVALNSRSTIPAHLIGRSLKTHIVARKRCLLNKTREHIWETLSGPNPARRPPSSWLQLWSTCSFEKLSLRN